jgi:hypothetical protein
MTTCPLLIAHQGREGPFIVWLESLGLKDLLQKYPLPILVEWGWIEPAYRIVVPLNQVVLWEQSEMQFCPPPTENPYDLLWDPSWPIDSDSEIEWFLHPLVRRTSPTAQLLRAQERPASNIALPEPIMEESGQLFWRYADFYYHWQAYALLDVFDKADSIQPIFNTPNAIKKAAWITKTVARYKQEDWDPKHVLQSPNKWAKWGHFLTVLSHYRALMEHLDWREMHSNMRDRAFRVGAGKTLAQHFAISAEMLQMLIREELLVLANRLLKPSPFKIDWQKLYWHELQKDVFLSVQWLCHLTGNPFEHYLREWGDPPHLQQEAMAKLADVLPFSDHHNRKQFLRNAPYYLSTYNALLSDSNKLVGLNLSARVDILLSQNQSFNGALFAFSEMHDAMTWDSNRKGIQFDERRPLDFYAHFATRVEHALREHITRTSTTSEKVPDLLSELMVRCAEKQKISDAVKTQFKKLYKDLTNLYDQPEDPIGKIMQLSTDLSRIDKYLLQSFLCANLARNYFAHHSYLDNELLSSEQSAFMIGGILVTLLILLPESVADNR